MVRLRSKTCPRRPRLSGAGGEGVTRAIQRLRWACDRSTVGAAGARPPLSLQASVGSKTRSAARSSHDIIPTTDQEDRPTPEVAPEQINRSTRRRAGGRGHRAWQENRVRRSEGPDQGEGRPARPPVPGPRSGRGPLLRGAQSEDRRPRVVRGDHHRARAHHPGPGRRPRSPWWPSTWWWRSSSTSSRRPRADWSAGPTPAAARPTRSRSCARRSAPPEGPAPRPPARTADRDPAGHGRPPTVE